MRGLLEEAISKFNEKARTDAKLHAELEGVVRKVLVDCKDGPKFNFLLKDQQIGPLLDGPVETPDVSILSDSATLTALLKKEMGPMKAYATQRLKVKASLDDLLRLRKFF